MIRRITEENSRAKNNKSHIGIQRPLELRSAYAGYITVMMIMMMMRLTVVKITQRARGTWGNWCYGTVENCRMNSNERHWWHFKKPMKKKKQKIEPNDIRKMVCEITRDTHTAPKNEKAAILSRCWKYTYV